MVQFETSIGNIGYLAHIINLYFIAGKLKLIDYVESDAPNRKKNR